MKISIVLLCLFIVFYGCSHPENSEKNSKVKTILNSEKDSSSFAEVADKEVHNDTTLPKKESMNAAKNNEWSTFKSEAYNFSVNYPKNWLIGETDLGVGTGPEEAGEIIWSISVYDNQTIDDQTIIDNIGLQFKDTRVIEEKELMLGELRVCLHKGAKISIGIGYPVGYQRFKSSSI